MTFALGIITFVLIHFNKFKHQKVSGVIKGLCSPWPIWAPINIISDLAVPVSLSLRLFANLLSGVIIMGLWYGMLPIFVNIGIPAALHCILRPVFRMYSDLCILYADHGLY